MKHFFLTLLTTYHLLLATHVHAQPKYEFRAAWIATVDNIDWPSKGNFNSDSQKVEFRRILDMHKRNGMNAVIVQIRPAADAFYPSQYEPWSEWLTGKQGKAPSPYYDPLAFMIAETHKRGMEFHAWCNPYRAVFRIGVSTIAATHITRVHPEWFLTYGDTKYFDPGNKDVQQFVTNVIRDIVRRYDIDAIHFDDYFYPYRIAGKEFPDYSSYSKYGNGMNKEDWRRSNTDSIIVMLGKAIKEEKKYCRFGISPFGIWRNASKDSLLGSNTKAGQTNYDDLYADIVLWLKNGWIDYVVPQLYFEFGHRAAPYQVLLDWWNSHSYGRHCYIGLGIFNANKNAEWRDKTMLPRQIDSLRKEANVQGMIFFSSKSFENNPNGWSDSLRLNYFKTPALIPPMDWIDTVKMHEPISSTKYNEKDSMLITSLQKNPVDDEIKGFAIYKSNQSTFNNDSSKLVAFIPFSPDAKFNLKAARFASDKNMVYYFVTAVSKTNTESNPVSIYSFSSAPTGK
ncbi:MAG TPA: family 10 glycosylhydrolase [Puia sp.]|nr:family 10 glycosylhydrolase [Puia sp.]